MPKLRIRAKGQARSAALVARRKFRVGRRKSGKSALLMSTAELLIALENSEYSRSKNNINAVLRMRGVAA